MNVYRGARPIFSTTSGVIYWLISTVKQNYILRFTDNDILRDDTLSGGYKK